MPSRIVVVIARNDVQGKGKPVRHVLELRDGVVKAGQCRNRVNDIAKVDDEPGLWLHARDICKNMSGALVGQVVCLKRRGADVIALIYVRVGDNDERKQGAFLRRRTVFECHLKILTLRL